MGLIGALAVAPSRALSWHFPRPKIPAKIPNKIKNLKITRRLGRLLRSLNGRDLLNLTEVVRSTILGSTDDPGLPHFDGDEGNRP